MNVNDMVRGLVRCAEGSEQDSGGKLWDDESRAALAEARARGWGKNHTGSLLDAQEKDPPPFDPATLTQQTARVAFKGWPLEVQSKFLNGLMAEHAYAVVGASGS